MKVLEYFAQDEHYFSESSHEFVAIAEMAPQYALNAHRKLSEEYGTVFADTPLASALALRFVPPTSKMRDDLTKYGKAIIYVGEGGLHRDTARRRLRKCGADHTHLNKEWMEGHAAPVEVKVRARKMTIQDEAEMVC